VEAVVCDDERTDRREEGVMSDPRDYADTTDLTEQEAPLDEDDDEVEVDSTDLEVDEADRLEQATPVRGDDDEYPEG
jgi:hypothetical protein